MTASMFKTSDPLRVVSPSILLRETIAAGTALRIVYNHVNGSAEPLTLALVIRNGQNETATFTYLGGHAGPDVDAVAVGHTATANFIRERRSQAAAMGHIAPSVGVSLIARGFAPNQSLCGIYQIENTSSGPIDVAVLVCPIGLDPPDALQTLPRAPSDVREPAALLSDEDPEARQDVNVTASAATDLPAILPLYGVVRDYRVRLINPKTQTIVVNLTVTTMGSATATLVVNDQVRELARTAPGSRAVVATFSVPLVEPDRDPFTVALQITSDINSSAPIVLSFAPAQPPIITGPLSANMKTPVAARVDSSGLDGSSARGIAAEVGSRPRTIPGRVAEPLATMLLAEAKSLTPHTYSVIIEIDPRSRATPALAFAAVRWLATRAAFKNTSIDDTDATHAYVFAAVTADQISAFLTEDARLAAASRLPSLVLKIWQDHVVTAQLIDSVPAVKADAAHASFAALGAGIVWAVIDSGVERHPHFEAQQNLILPDGLSHRDYSKNAPVDVTVNKLVDDFGHGTHVAGIIAGSWTGAKAPVAVTRTRDAASHQVTYVTSRLTAPLSGVAPRCKIVSMRVLDEYGTGNASSVIAALEDVLKYNEYGRNIRIHGVNLSVGYTFNPDWEACGATPICTSVNRLVASGVVVVVAAGNSGDTAAASAHGGVRQTGTAISINDPGNAERAITVGSCFSKVPHTLGIAPSSSKGPTSDGRPKPDIVAPGERIISCATKAKAALASGNRLPDDDIVRYIEDSGTSMAAPHVSGAAAAYLSVRSEFIGRPDDIKALVAASATDLKRAPSFQGAGLIDLFRMLVNS